ncbi:hypothetical protein SAMN06265365_106189 [Tistlia consotensis]|uniref:Uncharacterized protein n=1 Tax=Tistlia consotensis USBA 355 TaxID=560819 RepID=A0A1Y6BJY1_9PROT|nr:hypothetical protein [Tistlia consotensis]SMF04975.1 hypothetical protein SAMN05428998_103240 [Tistlia consotensis USBA 355]SNR54961.1 hypothetical protein SAMN06265365_106189 [Tistlia consotensis]
MTELALSALTDVILACGLYFLAGLSMRPDVERGSPAGLWALMLFLIATGTMLGVIDHAFYQPIGHPAHRWLMFATRTCLALASFTMLLSTARQFLSSGWVRLCTAIGLAGLVVELVLLFLFDNFLVVIAAYSLVLLLTLALHLANLRSRKGSLAMVAGIMIVLGASLLAPLGSQGLPGLGLYATYHIALMPGAIGFYLGGRRLAPTAA